MLDTYKVLVVGDKNVGKTTFVSTLRGTSQCNTLPTIGAEVHPVPFFIRSHTSNSSKPVCLNMWDVAGNDTLSGLRYGYYTHTNAIIAMFDTTNKKSLDNLSNWIDEVLSVCKDIPIVIVGTKNDINTPTYSTQDIEHLCSTYTSRTKSNVRYYNICTYNRDDYIDPLLDLIRQLVGDYTITL